MMMFEFIKRHVGFFIFVLLALPLTFSSPESAAPLHVGWPQIHSGDEPHYLIAINGLFLDGHLDLFQLLCCRSQGREPSWRSIRRCRLGSSHRVD